MVGMINEQGMLLVRRRGVFVQQTCCHTDVVRRCSHCCPLFDEYEDADNNIHVELFCGVNVMSVHINEDKRPTGGEGSE